MECMRQRVPVERQLLFKVEEMQHWENQLGPGPKDFRVQTACQCLMIEARRVAVASTRLHDDDLLGALL